MFYINFIYQLPTWDLAVPVIGATLPIPGVRALGITFALILIAVNLVGVKQTGGLQLVMVIVMLIILSGFVAGSIVQVEGANFEGFFDDGIDGILTATALVLVSYAGVTKVAAVAEDRKPWSESPARTARLADRDELSLRVDRVRPRRRDGRRPARRH